MMVTLLVYAYAVGVRSSRKIAAACERNLAFEPLSVTIGLSSARLAIFARIIWRRCGPCFLRCCVWQARWGWSSWGISPRTGQDGSQRVAAQGDELRLHDQGNERLKSEIEQLLKEAEQVDAEQDAVAGKRGGDELPDELKRREQRLAKIQEAKARLEAGPASRRRRNNAAVMRNSRSVKPKAANAGARNPLPSTHRADKGKRTSPTQIEDHEAEQQGIRLFVERSSGGG